jgi:hypothetical protein
MSVYTIEVKHTNRERDENCRLIETTHTVEVEASNEWDAALLALQFVQARKSSGMVTASRVEAVVL